MDAKNGFIRIAYLVCLIITAAAFSHATQPDSSTQSFTGEITDSLCAKAGSHDQMMQDMKSMGHDKATCTTKCIQLGAKYVLFDQSKGTVYVLDDQDKAAKFAGQRVRVSGTIEKKNIKVADIEPVN
jgi:Protein of unknown function (DUF5818)